MTTTTATAPEYRALTDPATKTWHLGSVERGELCYCGTRLMTPGDTRAFALKVPADARKFETSGDLSKVTCKACRRNRAWSQANGAAAAPLSPAPAATARKPRARTGTGTVSPAGAVSASALIEPDPETGLPRIRPDVKARADQVVAAQKARNARKAGR